MLYLYDNTTYRFGGSQGLPGNNISKQYSIVAARQHGIAARGSVVYNCSHNHMYETKSLSLTQLTPNCIEEANGHQANNHPEHHPDEIRA